MVLSTLRSPLTQLHCVSPTTELTSKDETTMVQRAGVFVHMHAHRTHLFFHPSAELERKMISYPKLFSEKAIEKSKGQIFLWWNKLGLSSLEKRQLSREIYKTRKNRRDNLGLIIHCLLKLKNK